MEQVKMFTFESLPNKWLENLAISFIGEFVLREGTSYCYEVDGFYSAHKDDNDVRPEELAGFKEIDEYMRSKGAKNGELVQVRFLRPGEMASKSREQKQNVGIVGEEYNYDFLRWKTYESRAQITRGKKALRPYLDNIEHYLKKLDMLSKWQTHFLLEKGIYLEIWVGLPYYQDDDIHLPMGFVILGANKPFHSNEALAQEITSTQMDGYCFKVDDITVTFYEA